MPKQFGSFIVIAVLNLKICTFYVFILFYVFYKKYFKCNRLLKIGHQISKDEMSRHVMYAEGMQNTYKTLIKLTTDILSSPPTSHHITSHTFTSPFTTLPIFFR